MPEENQSASLAPGLLHMRQGFLGVDELVPLGDWCRTMKAAKARYKAALKAKQDQERTWRKEWAA
ncbi:hypothetical protein [Pseudomonas sp. BN102]|uniref:hypothetical protein n=1 Tax=Pseudomonas sp. BN102 TaxID=2567886 RepID=UPI002454AD0C|nr:hypothetical protein [Pseudomonas sp. BN102]MDH4612001.1 hypothetical protein [Pseudomonas sp. BN102]